MIQKRLLVLLFAIPILCGAQQRPEDAGQAFARCVLQHSPKWRELVRRIHLNEIGLSYAQGKVLEQNVDGVNHALDLVEKLANDYLRVPRLTTEILLIDATLSLRHAFALLEVDMEDYAPKLTNSKQWAGWHETAQGLATGPFDTSFNVMVEETLVKADALERRDCH